MTQLATPQIEQDIKRDIKRAQTRFAELTGVTSVQVTERQSGLETFYDIVVGRRAPLYNRARVQTSDDLGEDSPLHGRLTLSPTDERKGIASMEAEALRSLIRGSLSVSREQLWEDTPTQHVPFASGEDNQAVESSDHVIWGRRGVGKSSLILHACRRLQSGGHPVAWVGAEVYEGRQDDGVLPELLDDVLRELEASVEAIDIPGVEGFRQGRRCLQPYLTGDADAADIGRAVRDLKACVGDYHQATGGRYCYVFVDDVHMIDDERQPVVFKTLLNVFRGAGGVVNIAGVKSLMALVLIPDDFQKISLDRTLVDPRRAKDHLEKVLLTFATECGFTTLASLVHPRALERLVWCSAGVPRDFLWLFERAVGYALQHGRTKVGKEDVNRATGELYDDKLERLDREGVKEADQLKKALDSLQSELLDKHNRNCFLVRHEPARAEYANLEKLVDLRFVHLLHEGITPSEKGRRFRAYLLDYSFYTGVRFRKGLKELEIAADSPPKAATLRRLPKLQLALFAPN